jgi:hypothetical protein
VGALTSAESATDPRFRVYLDLDDARFHALGVRQDPESSWVPVSRLVDTTVLLAWMRENGAWLTDSQIGVAYAVANAIREYQIPTYVVTAADEIALRMIFDRLNNTGRPMTRAEVFHALHAGQAGDEPDSLPGIGTVAAELGFGRLDDRLVFRSVLAYRGGDISGRTSSRSSPPRTTDGKRFGRSLRRYGWWWSSSSGRLGSHTGGCCRIATSFLS